VRQNCLQQSSINTIKEYKKAEEFHKKLVVIHKLQPAQGNEATEGPEHTI